MLIKDSRPTKIKFDSSLNNTPRKSFLLGILATFSFIGLVGIGIFFKLPADYKSRIASIISEKYSAFKNGLYNSLSLNTVAIENMNIDIKQKNFDKLMQLREEAKQSGVLSSGDDDAVDASLRWQNDMIDAKVRLKGRMGDHWESQDQLSLRISLKGDKTILGMKNFDIHAPETRGFLNEWYMHQLMKYSGLIYLRYDFITAQINGKPKQLYAVEEKFDKRLIEHNNRREGITFKLNTDYYWTNYGKPGIINQGFFVSEVAPFGLSAINTDSFQMRQFNLITNLFERFRKNEISTSDLFDTKGMAKFLAIIDLTNHHHASLLDNIRFYYNPITLKIEPIFHDNQIIAPLSKNGYSILGAERIVGQEAPMSSNLRQDPWYDFLFKDKEFYREYISALNILSQDSFLTNFNTHIQKELNEKEKTIQKYYPSYSFTSIPILQENQKTIRDYLSRDNSVLAFLDKSQFKDGQLRIELLNTSRLPVEVTHVIFRDSISIPLSNKIFLQATNRYCAPQSIYVNVPFKDTLIGSAKVGYHVFGLMENKFDDIRSWSRYLDTEITNNIIHKPSNLSQFGFITVQEKDKIILFSGQAKLTQDLILPPGYTIKAQSGFKLDILNNSVLISHSPLNFIGTSEQPIQIYSSDTSAMGVVILNAEKLSTLKYVTFSNLKNPIKKTWQLSSTVTFYQSPVLFDNCIFYKTHRGDDALNTVRTTFTMTNCIFNGSLADAFDSDFCEGKIINTQFLNCGNDAIDVSGSFIELEKITINKTGDKGISCGEASNVFGKNITIENAEIAVTAKDKANVTLDNIDIKNSKIGYAVYRKKPEYGYAVVEVTNGTISGSAINYLNELNSHLKINKISIIDTATNVESLFYGHLYGKASK